MVKILRELGDEAVASHAQRFFKTGKGEYGEGDKFLGVRVPVLRAQAKTHKALSLAEIGKLLKSRFHEVRQCALFMLVARFKSGDEATRKAVYTLYKHSTAFVNNWDLVDCSAHYIAGPYLETRSRRQLYTWAKSTSLWERRIAIMTTMHFLRGHDFDDTLKLAALLRDDPEDLIHKAVGWLLREVGNRDLATEKAFLKQHYKKMPRTMLRYAIEKFPDRERKRYLAGSV